MLYLLDANVLIDADRDYYPIERVPEFWEWLIHMGTQGVVKIPLETFDEVRVGHGPLADWMRRQEVEDALLLDTEVDPQVIQRVISEGYAPDLTDIEIEEMGKDPFLIARCCQNAQNHCVVTTESSRPNRIRANRHVPDVCATFNVRCVNTFAFVRELDFSTSWNR